MAYRKKTLRKMSPTARKVARLAGELDSVSRRLKNLVPDLQDLDFQSKAFETARRNKCPGLETCVHMADEQEEITRKEVGGRIVDTFFNR